MNLVDQIKGAKRTMNQKWRETSLCSIQLKAEPSHYIKGAELFPLDPDLDYINECISTVPFSIE